MIRKKYSISGRMFVVALMMLLLLTGCASEERYITQENDTITLRSVTMFGGLDANATVYEHIWEDFLEENPGIYINDESRTADEQWKAEVAADFCAGNEPDVLQFFTDATANQLVAMDKFVTIEEIREYEPDYAKDTYPWALEQVANSDGVQRAVPTTGFWEGLYCNSDLFEKYHVDYPTDWESFQQAVEVFHAHGVVPVACSLAEVPHYWVEHLMLYTVGEEAYKEIPEEVPEDWCKALALFQKLNEINAFPPNADIITNDYARSMFLQKEAAMILEGNWFLPLVEDQKNTVVIAFPGVPDGKEEKGTLISGMSSGFYITKRAFENPKKRDIAIRYVMAQTSSAAVQKYWEHGGGTARAATAVRPLESQTTLTMSVEEFLQNSQKQVLPLDSRMDPEAYTTLIEGIIEIYAGGDPDKLWNEVLAINTQRKTE